MVATLTVASTSRTPRQQLLLSHTAGRARVDAMVLATSGNRASGRRSLEEPSSNAPAHRGTKKVPDAVAARNNVMLETRDPRAPGEVHPPAGRRHFHRDPVDCDVLLNPTHTAVKRGVRYFRERETPESAGNTSLKPTVDASRLRRADSIRDVMQQRQELASPTRHGFTFVPVEKEKKQTYDTHTNKTKRFWRRETAESAVVPPWV